MLVAFVVGGFSLKAEHIDRVIFPAGVPGRWLSPPLISGELLQGRVSDATPGAASGGL